MKLNRTENSLRKNDFSPVISKDMNMPFISFRKSCPYYGQWLYLVYYRDTGFEFIGKLAKHLGIYGPIRTYENWQNIEVGFDLNEIFNKIPESFPSLSQE